jgi:hypothetical protein
LDDIKNYDIQYFGECMEMQINTTMTAGAGLTYNAPQPTSDAGQSGAGVAPSNPDQATVNMAANVTDVVEINNNPASVKPTANDVAKVGNNENPTNSKGVVVSFDQLANTEVIKFMDIKGNVVAQVPPRMYLKMMEAMGSSMAEMTGGSTTGKHLDEIV